MEKLAWVYLFVTVMVALVTLILLIYTLVERRRLEQLTHNLGGKWTWTYALGAGRAPVLTVRLWPDRYDTHTAQIMDAATFFQAWLTPQGEALVLYEETVGHLKLPFYQLTLSNRQSPASREPPQAHRIATGQPQRG